MNYQNEVSVLMEVSMIYLNQTISETWKTSIRIKSSMDMTLNEFIYLTNTYWNEKDQPLTIDTTKDKYTGRYRLGLNSIFVPINSSF